MSPDLLASAALPAQPDSQTLAMPVVIDQVALARLYLEGPPLWILDEPFTALDKQGVAQLEEHLARHCEQGGMVVLTTHHTLTRMPAGYRDLDLGRWSV